MRIVQGEVEVVGSADNESLRTVASQMESAEIERTTAEIELVTAARLAQRKRLGPFRPETARAGFSYDVARRVIDAASPDDLPTI